jgi:hypothetical protein
MMKSLAVLIAICFGLVLASAFNAPAVLPRISQAEITAEPQYPEKTGALIMASCYDCHTTGAKAKEALDALNFKTFNEYRITKRIGLLNEICEKITGGHMPPKKFLRNHPEKALSETDIDLICDWTRKTAAKLME